MRWAKYIKWGKNCTIAMIFIFLSIRLRSSHATAFSLAQNSYSLSEKKSHEKKIIYTTARKTKPEKKTAAVDEKDGEK